MGMCVLCSVARLPAASAEQLDLTYSTDHVASDILGENSAVAT